MGRYGEFPGASTYGQATANSLTRKYRFQEECQPGDDPGDDEDWYDLIPVTPIGNHFMTMAEQGADSVDIPGHVERTNDRDYEVEERSIKLLKVQLTMG